MEAPKEASALKSRAAALSCDSPLTTNSILSSECDVTKNSCFSLCEPKRLIELGLEFTEHAGTVRVGPSLVGPHLHGTIVGAITEGFDQRNANKISFGCVFTFASSFCFMEENGEMNDSLSVKATVNAASPR